MMLDDEFFFDTDHSREPMDRIAKAALLMSLHRNIKADLYELGSSFAIMAQIRRRFTTFSRAAQLNKWADLFRIPCDRTTDASSVAALYRHRLADLRKSGISFDTDSILALILHASIAHGTKLRQEFDMSIDRELSVRRDLPLNFSDYIDVLSSCRERVRARDADRHREPLPSGFSSQIPDGGGLTRSASIESHPDNVYMLAGRPANFRTPTPQPRSCFRCGSSSHLISQCNIAAPPVTLLV
jgi:hypothetical protein